jgi:hypothetical protein
LVLAAAPAVDLQIVDLLTRDNLLRRRGGGRDFHGFVRRTHRESDITG